MSVVGIDFGNRFCTIAVAQRNGIDVILNEVSSRQNSTMVSFGDKERVIGESAATQHLRNLQNTITDIKRIIGRKSTEKDLIQELTALPMRYTATENKDIEFDVFCRGESKKFTPVQITGMMLHQLKLITEKAIDKTVKEVVISVPGWWNDAQRRAMSDAAAISGWHCLKLVNEHTAVATNYGLFKANPGDNETQHIMFVDVGHSQTTVSIAEFTKGKIKVLATAYDRWLGGRNFDKLLAEHFATAFKTKYKIDIKSNRKAWIRLEQACERLKKMFTTNPDATFSVDSIMNDIDVKGDMKRPEFEAMVAPLLKRLLKTVQKALDEANLTAEKLHSVEVVGGTTRMLTLQSTLSDFLKKEVRKTMNPEEAVAKGCALQCAMLTPYFKVKETAITDIQPYPIRVFWRNLSANPSDPINPDDSADIIPKGDALPSKLKLLSFSRSEPFEIVAEYKLEEAVQTEDVNEPQHGLDASIPRIVARCVVSQLSSPTNATPTLPASIRAKVKLSHNGTLVFDSVQLLETVEETETATTAPSTDAKQETTPMETTPTSPPPSNTQPAETEDSKKKKVRRVDLPFNELSSALPLKTVQAMTDEEGKLQAEDKLIIETADKKCALESMIYDLRDKLKDASYGSFGSAEDKAKLEKIMDASLSWLYEDGAEATKSVYQTKIDEIKVISDPINTRRIEAESRYAAVNNVKSYIAQMRSFVTSSDPKYEHITAEERQPLSKACDDVEAFLNTKISEQEKRSKIENPVITVAQINAKKVELEKLSSIMNKVKPPPPKPAEQPKQTQEPPKPADQQQTQQPATEENKEQPTTQTAPKPESDKAMDLD